MCASLEDILAQTAKNGNLETDDDPEEEPEVDNSSNITIDEDGPVLPGHWLSFKSCVLLVWLYAMAHSLTAAELTVKIGQSFSYGFSPVFKSLYRFKSFFFQITSPFTKHFYCSTCVNCTMH